MKVSVIIPTYKDVVALELILDAFENQTYKNFEVIIAEDDNSTDTKMFLKNSVYSFEIQHFFHEDMGNRKPVAVNHAIKMSKGQYVIFIDGDTIPFSRFIENHVKLSSPKVGLCGRRVNLGDSVSQDLRISKITALEIEKYYLQKYKYLTNDNIRHYEQGFEFNPKSWVYKLISYFNKNANIVASNFSCYKDVLIEVNGVDAGLPYAPSRDDYDLQWRLEHIGVKMKIAKYSANLFHLNHSRTDREFEDLENRKLIDEKKRNKIYIAQNGIENKIDGF